MRRILKPHIENRRRPFASIRVLLLPTAIGDTPTAGWATLTWQSPTLRKVLNWIVRVPLRYTAEHGPIGRSVSIQELLKTTLRFYAFHQRTPARMPKWQLFFQILPTKQCWTRRPQFF